MRRQILIFLALATLFSGCETDGTETNLEGTPIDFTSTVESGANYTLATGDAIGVSSTTQKNVEYLFDESGSLVAADESNVVTANSYTSYSAYMPYSNESVLDGVYTLDPTAFAQSEIGLLWGKATNSTTEVSIELEQILSKVKITIEEIDGSDVIPDGLTCTLRNIYRTLDIDLLSGIYADYVIGDYEGFELSEEIYVAAQEDLDNVELSFFDGKYDYPVVTHSLKPTSWIAGESYEYVVSLTKNISYVSDVILTGDSSVVEESQITIDANLSSGEYYRIEWTTTDSSIKFVGDTGGESVVVEGVKITDSATITFTLYRNESDESPIIRTHQLSVAEKIVDVDSVTIMLGDLEADESLSVEIGAEAITLSASALAADPTETPTDSSVVWSVEGNDGSYISYTTNNDGTISITGLTRGEDVVITATAADGSGASDSITINVVFSANATYVTNIGLNTTSADLTVGRTLTLTPTITPNEADDCAYYWTVSSGGDEFLTWESGDLNTSAPLKIKGLKESAGGTITVTVTAKGSENVGSATATCEITVIAAVDIEFGDYLYLDGTYSATYDNTKTLLGVIYSVDNSTQTGYLLYTKDLQGASLNKTWTSNETYQAAATGATATANGRNNMATIQGLTDATIDQFPPINWCHELNNTVLGLKLSDITYTSTSANLYYLMAETELKTLLTTLFGDYASSYTNETSFPNIYNTQITNAGGDIIYCVGMTGVSNNDANYASSTDNASEANKFRYGRWQKGGVSVWGGNKTTNQHRVRAIMQFDINELLSDD